MRKSFRSQSALIIFVLLAIGACADDQYDRKRSKEAEETAEKMRGAVEAEIKTLKGHPWAGDYYYGDGLGVNVSLAIAPKSGYVFAWHGCLGLYDRNYGAVSEKDGRLQLSFTFKNDRKGFQGIAPELVPVTWGARMYLVPADEMIDFCNEVNSGSEPRPSSWGSHLLRRGDEKKKVSGFPAVPREYERYLLKKPIVGNIIAVGASVKTPLGDRSEWNETTVTLNVGKDDGVLPGMEFCVVTPGVFAGNVKVTKVEKKKAEGVMTQIGKNEAAPKAGWKMSTRALWHLKGGRVPEEE